jgi:prepilin-type processing-associated H-X9-DG protein
MPHDRGDTISDFDVLIGDTAGGRSAAFDGHLLTTRDLTDEQNSHFKASLEALAVANETGAGPSVGGSHTGGVNAVLCDGSVRFTEPGGDLVW